MKVNRVLFALQYLQMAMDESRVGGTGGTDGKGGGGGGWFGLECGP